MSSPKYTTAAFLGSGFIEHPQATKILAHWDAGHVELVGELVGYVDYIEALFEAGKLAVGDVPGVFDYEVTEAVAFEFGNRVLMCEPGTIPNPVFMCQHIRELTYDFYCRAWGMDQGNVAEKRENLSAVLAAVPMYAEAV